MRLKITSINKETKTIFSNWFSLTILQAANYILPLLILPFLVRVLGIEKFGLIMFAQSIATFLMIAVDFGFEISGTREISISRNDKQKVSQIFSSIIAIKFILIIVWFLILFFVVEFISRFKEDAIVYYLSFGMVVGHAIFPVWFFQGIEKMKFVTLINILAKIIFTLLIFIVIRSESDYYLVPAFNSLGYIVAGVLGLLISLRHTNLSKPAFGVMKKLITDSTSLFLGKFATNLFTTCNVLILGLFAGNTVVGVFSSMEKLLLAVKNIYSPFYVALFPWLSKQLTEKRGIVIKRITPFVIGIGVTITAAILIFGDKILIFIYDDSLINSYNFIFKILGLNAIFAGLNMLFLSLYFPAVKLYKTRMYVFVIGGFLHLILSVILVKLYNIYGMAIAVVFTEFFLLVLAYFFFIKHQNKQV
jgi:PST family polysaccharide transporter